MLQSLSVTNIVLIEQLTLQFDDGLTVLTGETGAGKSILLDALGLALGSRANFGLIRQGSTQAQVSASFHMDAKHPVWALLEDAGVDIDDTLILRRRLKADGKSSASINDVPVSVGLLHKVGDLLVEIQGQFEGRGLLDVSRHITLLDRAAGHQEMLDKLSDAHAHWMQSKRNLATAKLELDQARADEEWLRDAVHQLDALSPSSGEEAQLVSERDMLANVGKIGETLALADHALTDENGAQASLGSAMATLEKSASLAGSALDNALAALSRADAELSEAISEISAVGSSLEADPNRLESVDDRLHELRQQARKHNCNVDGLVETHQQLASRLAAIEDSSGTLAELADNERQWRDYYTKMAKIVSDARKSAAALLDRAVMAELPPLKLENATFHSHISALPADQWGALGMDMVRFEASTNRGMAQGPIDRIASGGELARFLLALKVALEDSNTSRTLIFDEVDSGVGGAVAAAVGDRLARLGEHMQTLVITHSPQVAARGVNHMRIAKHVTDESVISGTETLSDDARTEEIARMLAGEHITAEARAAATALLEG
ncbi:DNA repair protein RecN [Candidatus Puniceispirillum marinum]|uniref:DNA repair protein RecN n=1 Tax=Puniceispirillum marinum (strain IMCC1322) TaxID=488538 RepID=D5BPR6_PUNMI|nr:DNA repair protein RecN [Candidatus Puniceispirillum marinum]ADE40568.1 ATPase involved in DNA repair [Candidatus Puniceispirillum marinum IMCC1322]